MSRGEIKLHPCSRSRNLKIRGFKKIEEHTLGDEYYYYVKNDYDPSDYEPGITLYAFKIVKTTRCFHFLINGQRISVGSDGPNLSRTPTGALKYALRRANAYQAILNDKMRKVSSFIELAKGSCSNRELRELRGFDNFAHSVEDVDDIPAEAYRELFEQQKDIPY